MARGILTGITGNRADGIVWDDLIRGREQADFPVVRQKTWEAYVDDLSSRKKPLLGRLELQLVGTRTTPQAASCPNTTMVNLGW